MSAVLAVDLGGTKTLAALVEGPRVLDRRAFATDRAAGPDGWTAQLAAAVADWHGRFAAIGVAVTGLVARGAWSALNRRTLPVPDAYPLADRVAALMGHVPVLANDAQAAAWGEYLHGAGQGRDLAFLTVSTGIGGGLVLNGRLVGGHRGLAGSFGQTLLPGGARVEDRASGRWIAAAAARRGHPCTAPEVFAAAAAGEVWAEEIVAASAAHVSRLCRNILFSADPELIVIGGGVGLAEGYLDRLAQGFDGLPPSLRPTLARAALGAEAGVIGIAALVSASSP
jgi:predicted NBD/HSP70 family sugar kinase